MPKIVTPRIGDSTQMYSKRYERFRGVDFSTDPTQVSESRSPFCQNLIADMAGFPEKRPGWRTLQRIEGPVNGLFYCAFESGATAFLAHGGTKLYRWSETGEPEEIYGGMNDARSASFAHKGKLYILDGRQYLVCGEVSGIITISRVAEEECFIPTTVIGAPAAGGGTLLEAVNLLSPKRINSMIGDGLSVRFVLDTANLDAIESVKLEGVEQTISAAAWARAGTDEGAAVSFLIPSVPTGTQFYLKAGGRTYLVVDGEGAAVPPSTLVSGQRRSYLLTKAKDAENEYYLAKPFTYSATGTPNAPTVTAAADGSAFALTSTEYQKDLAAGTVEFALPPQEYTGGGGVDNVVIRFSKEVPGYADKIEKCTIAQFYGINSDNRIFVAGNPDEPNVDYHSGLDDPTYFPDTGYTKIGADTSKIMGYVKQGSSLAIIKSDNQQDAEIYLRTATLQSDGTIIFPVAQGVKGIGAISKYAFGNLRDDPLFLAREGVFGIVTTSITQQRALQDRSYYVNAKLTREENLQNAVACLWNGFYLLCVNGHCYAADGRQRTAASRTEQNGYEWYYWTNIPARVFLEHDGALYFGTEDGRICRFNTDIAIMSRYNDDGEAIIARWATKSDDFGTMMRKKTLLKRGCGVMIKPYTRSSVKVYAATDTYHERTIREDTMDIFTFADVDFGRFTFNTMDVPQVVAFNTKVKKFITLQLIFENDVADEGFGVFGAQVQYTTGNYVK